MRSLGKRTACLLAGFILAAGYAVPQAYTLSAKPGAVNYVEGSASINGAPVNEKDLKSTFLNANDILSTDLGKAEVLLAPGIFLRMGDNTKIRMVSPSLVTAQVEVMSGEVMVEATGLVKGSSVQVISRGASTNIEKNGLYRFLADDPPSVAVLEGKAAVTYSDRKVDVKKGRQVILAENLKPEKFDAKKDDELYAWSNVRSEYDAAASYRLARSAQMGLLGSAYTAGFGGVGGPGWFWDSAFSSWAWLPGAGAFYSPFGYGFYSPALVGYAPVISAPIYRGGRWAGGRWNGSGTPPVNGWHGRPPVGGTVPNGGAMAAVPLSPNNPAAVGSITASPWANHAARMQARQSWAASGMTTASGAQAPGFAGHGNGARPAGNSGWQGSSRPGGWSGGGHMGQGGGRPGGWSGGAGGHTGGGGGHAGGGGGGHR